MQTDENEEVVKRFFKAIYALKDCGVIRGKQTFTNRYGINRWNLNTLEKEPHRSLLKISWLSYLVTDYGISGDWLLTGRGDMFSKHQKVARYGNVLSC